MEQAERAKVRAEQNADALKTQSKVWCLQPYSSSCPRLLPYSLVCGAGTALGLGCLGAGLCAALLPLSSCVDLIGLKVRTGACLQGLENEYDRLLAEHDALKRRLARFDPSFQGGTGKKGM